MQLSQDYGNILSMIEALRKQEKDKQRLLWGALATLSLPATPFLLNDAIIDSAKSLWREIKYKAENKFGYVPKPLPADERLFLKPEHDLYKWADQTAKGQGLELRHISIRPEDKNKPITNATVVHYKNKIFLSFEGDPTASNPSLTKAIIAHELGHFTAGENTRFKKIAMTTTSTYAWLAQTTLSLGVLAQGIQALSLAQNNDLNPVSAVMMGVGAASLAAISVTSKLAREFNHSVEHLADLKASEIVCPEDVVAALGELKVHREEQIEATNPAHSDEPTIEGSKMSLRSAWHMVIDHLKRPMKNTHPSPDARQDFIRNAYSMTESAQQVAYVAPAAKPNNIGRNLPV